MQDTVQPREGCNVFFCFKRISAVSFHFSIAAISSFSVRIQIIPTAVKEMSMGTCFKPSSSFSLLWTSIRLIKVSTMVGVNSFKSVHSRIASRKTFKSIFSCSAFLTACSSCSTAASSSFCSFSQFADIRQNRSSEILPSTLSSYSRLNSRFSSSFLFISLPYSDNFVFSSFRFSEELF